MEQEYKTPNELLNFVLKECSDITYSWNSRTRTLTIGDNFNMEKVFYAIKLLKEHFKININTLGVCDFDIEEIPENYLVDTNIKKLHLSNNVKRIPKLPYSLDTIYTHHKDYRIKHFIYNIGYTGFDIEYRPSMEMETYKFASPESTLKKIQSIINDGI